MKRLICLFMALLLAMPLTGCGESTTGETAAETDAVETASDTEETLPALNLPEDLDFGGYTYHTFPMIWLFASGTQRFGASASASVLPMNIQG